MAAAVAPEILLVEDNPADVELLKARLSAARASDRFLLDTANTLEAGLESLAKKEYDLVLLDLMLPDSEGLDTFERIFQRKPNTPIVVFSGIAQDALARQLVALGAQDFIEKDNVSINGLNQQLLFAMGRRQAADMARQQVQERSIYWLADTIAQEFNVILANLMSDLNGIEAPLKDAPDALKRARQASHGALAGADVMHLLLALARPASAGAKQPLGTLVDDMLPSLRQQFGETIDIDITGSDASWVSVFDDSQVRTILFTIIGNVMSQLTPPVALKLSCSNGKPQSERNAQVTMEMPRGEFSSIQISATGSQSLGGNGNGNDLANQPGQKLVQGFIEKLGGALYSRSHPVLGVTLEILLPRDTRSSDFSNQIQEAARVDVRSINVVTVGLDATGGSSIASQIGTLGYHTVMERTLDDVVKRVSAGFRVDLLVVTDSVLSTPEAMESLSVITGYSFESKLLVVCNDKPLERRVRNQLPLPHTLLVAPDSLAEIDAGLRSAHFAELDS
ncbi:MAG: response regulator [Woeseiaceae bacterium]